MNEWNWFYQPQEFIAFVQSIKGGWLPEELVWFYRNFSAQRAECCGIFGGNDLNFIHYYANTGLKLIEHWDNHTAWSQLENKTVHMVLVEQYLLSACIEFHRHQSDSPFANVQMDYLFQSVEEAFDPLRSQTAGYTHLIGDSKRDPDLAERLEKRVARDYPKTYERCLHYLNARIANI